MDFDKISSKINTETASFTNIRKEGYVYVDKTKSIYDLAHLRKFFFLSRPRRFGKSTIVSTLEELFKHGIKSYDGHDSYFKDLAIEKLWTDNGEYKVFHLDLSTIDDEYLDDPEKLSRSVLERINNFAQSYSLNIKEGSTSIADSFAFVLEQVEDTSVVFLIDEYDYPLTKNLEHPEYFDKFVIVLRNLYKIIKAYSQKFRFVFVTGITRYKDSFLFTSGSPIKDISQEPKFGTIVGFTKDELLDVYKENLKWVASKKYDIAFEKVATDQLEKVLAEISYWYDGYSFDRENKTHVFTTWSILNLFSDENANLTNYWYESAGIPSILANSFDKIIERRDEILSNDILVPTEKFNNPATFKTMDARVLLFQTGYLSFYRPCDEDYYYLKFPNFEVFNSFKKYLLNKAFDKDSDTYKRSKSKVLDSFDSPSDIIDYFNSILNCIDFELFPITSEAAVVAYLQMFLSGQNYYKSIMVNHHSSLGRADLIVDSNNRRLVFEFKFDKDGKHSLELLQKAKEQLQDKRYGKTVDCPPNFKAIATVYDATTRKLTSYEEVNY